MRLTSSGKTGFLSLLAVPWCSVHAETTETDKHKQYRTQTERELRDLTDLNLHSALSDAIDNNVLRNRLQDDSKPKRSTTMANLNVLAGKGVDGNRRERENRDLGISSCLCWLRRGL